MSKDTKWMRWTKEEEVLLGTRPDEEIARLLGRTIARIKARRWSLHIMKYPAEANKILFDQGKRICTSCGEIKTLESYDKHPEARGGIQSRCRKCKVKREKERIAERKSFWVQEMGGKCSRCGYDEFLAGLTFHHIGAKDPQWNSSYWQRSSDVVRAELDKCALLCACCHNALHFNGSPLGACFVKNEIGLGYSYVEEANEQKSSA